MAKEPQIIEQTPLSEISKKTLGSYIKKANASSVGIAAVQTANTMKTGGKGDPDDRRQLKNRVKGISRATDRLTKEEVEQVDEVSTSTLGAYIKKAVPDAEKKMVDGINKSVAGHTQMSRGDDAKAYHNFDASGKLINKSNNRKAHINKAVDKMTKESETTPEWPVYARIMEKVKDPHTKGATETQKHGDNWAGKDTDFINTHGGIDGNEPEQHVDDDWIEAKSKGVATKMVKKAPLNKAPGSA